MLSQFFCPLQTALHNTQGALRGKAVAFEPTRESQPPHDIIADHASIVRQISLTLVYDAGTFGLALVCCLRTSN